MQLLIQCSELLYEFLNERFRRNLLFNFLYLNMWRHRNYRDRCKRSHTSLKTRKAVEEDGIKSEILKSMGEKGEQILPKIINTWKRKKNCGGISLLSAISKAYERILEKRIRRRIVATLADTQAGFRPKLSWQDWFLHWNK